MPSPILAVAAVGVALAIWGVAGAYHGARKAGHKIVHVLKHGARKHTDKKQTCDHCSP